MLLKNPSAQHRNSVENGILSCTLIVSQANNNDPVQNITSSVQSSQGPTVCRQVLQRIVYYKFSYISVKFFPSDIFVFFFLFFFFFCSCFRIFSFYISSKLNRKKKTLWPLAHLSVTLVHLTCMTVCFKKKLCSVIYQRVILPPAVCCQLSIKLTYLLTGLSYKVGSKGVNDV